MRPNDAERPIPVRLTVNVSDPSCLARLTLPCVACGSERVALAVPELDAEIVLCAVCDATV
jgi:hypothetical protein